jgi:hypothetical protein
MKGLISFLILAFSLFSLSTLVTSCDDDDNCEPAPANNSSIKLIFELYNGATPMAWNEVVSVDNVNEYRMEFFKYYLSNINAVNSGGGKVLLKDVILADASKTDGMIFTFLAPSGSYEKLMIGVGLDAVLNAKDPVTFDPDEPLSAAQAMYWSWATKYRFVRIDGRASQNGAIGDTSDILVAYHPGADEFYSEIELVKSFNLEAGITTEYRVKVDVAAFFDGPGGILDIPTEPQSHTTPDDYPIAEKFMKNFAAAFSPM